MFWRLKTIAGIILGVIIYSEFWADYVEVNKCKWPTINGTHEHENLHVMILADTHLLGPIKGHWLDKFYREWHMRKAFQSAVSIFYPDVVFILGDLFDEGDLVNDLQFEKYVKQFLSDFKTPMGTTLVSAAGNHDIGFHYKMPVFIDRFEENFKNTGVQLYTFNKVHFVVINSMAMENDGCYYCQKAKSDLNKIYSTLNCLNNSLGCKNDHIRLLHKEYSRPIIMQHFPTYRKSDKFCDESDTPNVEKFREKWEVLSKESTDFLGKLLFPRLVFAGHSHHHCKINNSLNVEEYTVASFNWRNKVNPSFLLAKFTQTQHAVVKCNMLKQEWVYDNYIYALIACMIILVSYIVTYLKNYLSSANQKNH